MCVLRCPGFLAAVPSPRTGACRLSVPGSLPPKRRPVYVGVTQGYFWLEVCGSQVQIFCVSSPARHTGQSRRTVSVPGVTVPRVGSDPRLGFWDGPASGGVVGVAGVSGGTDV